MLRLRCVAQKYDWGLKGSASTVGRLFALSSGQEIGDEVPYAELWMGTHPSGPSTVLLDESSGTSLLQDWLEAHPEALGDAVRVKWGSKLPFLFKVLSVAKALSIQAHPDKSLAEKLHARNPAAYKDDNHKPEMAIAVTQFEALCSFVKTEELRSHVSSFPELAAVLGQSIASQLSGPPSPDSEADKTLFRIAFSTLMTSSKETVAEQLGKLTARLREEEKSRPLSPTEALLLRLDSQYPGGDVGVFALFFLNFLSLSPGQAIFLPANEPHAYLDGECVECMAASDNVVRAGLTPKFRDTDTLCSMLTYSQGPPEILSGTPISPFTRLYSPPFDEFEVEATSLPLGQSTSLPLLPGPSILLVLKGQGAITQTLTLTGEKSFSGTKEGDVFFVSAGAQLQLAASVDVETKSGVVTAAAGAGGAGEEGLLVYRARVNSRVVGQGL